MKYIDDWVDFCMSREEMHGEWYSPIPGSWKSDYNLFIRDYNAGVPRAVEFMIAYAKYKLTR